MRVFLILIVILIVAAFSYQRGQQAALAGHEEPISEPAPTTPPPLYAASPEAETILRKARTLILPALEFREASLRECVAFLAQKSQQVDPDRKGINVVIELPVLPPSPGIAIPGLDPQPVQQSDDAPIIPLVTLSLRNVNVLQAVEATAHQAGLLVRAESYGLVRYRLSTKRK